MSQATVQEDALWGDKDQQFNLIARNVSMKYIAMGVDWALGLVMLPFNVRHLGASAYGLWMIVASITVYFSMLDMGFGSAQVKFAAQYRARRDASALNEISSTTFFLFSVVSVFAYAVALALAFSIDKLFKVTSEQAATGRNVLLVISVYVALGFPFSVFGGIVNGFMRPYLNGMISIATSLLVAIVNVVMLLAGYGLVELVIATTAIRVLSCFAYRINAYRVFPALEIRFKHFRKERLRELSGFSFYLLIIDLANKLNYSTDTMVIGAFISPAAVAVYSIGQRLTDLTQRLSNQLNGAVFPVIVDSATTGHAERLKLVFLQGTRVSLAMVIPITVGLTVLANPLVTLWVGPKFSESVAVIDVLAVVVAIRVGCATSTTLLKGGGRHRFLALTNVVTGVLNLILSIVFVKIWGLVGVAMGTLVPLSVASLFIIFPAACRRVGVSIRQALAQAVWPPVWPALVVGLVLLATRNLVGLNRAALLAQAAAGGIIYVAVFLIFAIGPEERGWYLGKIKQLRRSRVMVAS